MLLPFCVKPLGVTQSMCHQVERSDIQRHACDICKWHLQVTYTGSSFCCNCRAYWGIPWYTHMTWSLSMLLEWMVKRDVAVLTVHPYDPNTYLLQWGELEKARILFIYSNCKINELLKTVSALYYLYATMYTVHAVIIHYEAYLHSCKKLISNKM